MQQDTALEQREACLSIRAPFDPFHFIDEPLDHAVAPGQTPSVGHGLRITCIPERQFPRPTGRRCGTPGSIAKKDEEMSVF